MIFDSTLLQLEPQIPLMRYDDLKPRRGARCSWRGEFFYRVEIKFLYDDNERDWT